MGNIHGQSNRGVAVRVYFEHTQESRQSVAVALHRENIGYDGTGSQDCGLYQVRTEGDLQVGFKYIAETMDRVGPDKFVFGCEESHGYLVGQYARDKDAGVAAMLLAEYAALLKSQGKTLHDALAALFWQHGYHVEKQLSLTMPGSAGMRDMQTIMARFRSSPPKELAGFKVTAARDYQNLVELKLKPNGEPVGPATSFVGPKGDMVILELSEPAILLLLAQAVLNPRSSSTCLPAKRRKCLVIWTRPRRS